MPFGRLLAAFRHARLVFDPLVSLLDTFAGDRGLVRSGGGKAAAVRAVDEVAFRLPRLVLADTWAHAAYYQEAFGLARDRLAVVPVGALPEPRADGAAQDARARRAADGAAVRQVEPAARRRAWCWRRPSCCAPSRSASCSSARDSSRPSCAASSRRADSRTSSGSGELPAAELRAHTLAADVCLGVFGGSEKAARVVPNKVFDGLACGRPVVTADSDGAREWLRDGETALLTPAGDAAALAAALRRLLDERERVRLGEAALGLYRRAFTPAAVAGELLDALERT